MQNRNQTAIFQNRNNSIFATVVTLALLTLCVVLARTALGEEVNKASHGAALEWIELSDAPPPAEQSTRLLGAPMAQAAPEPGGRGPEESPPKGPDEEKSRLSAVQEKIDEVQQKAMTNMREGFESAIDKAKEEAARKGFVYAPPESFFEGVLRRALDDLRQAENMFLQSDLHGASERIVAAHVRLDESMQADDAKDLPEPEQELLKRVFKEIEDAVGKLATANSVVPLGSLGSDHAKYPKEINETRRILAIATTRLEEMLNRLEQARATAKKQEFGLMQDKIDKAFGFSPLDAPDVPPRLPEDAAAMLREDFPDMLDQWHRFEQDKAFGNLRDINRFAEEMHRLRVERPELYEMEKQIHILERKSIEIGERIRSTEAKPKRPGLEDELRATLQRLFDMREERREGEARDIEKELDRIRDILAKRKAGREAIINRRFEQLTGTQDALEW